MSEQNRNRSRDGGAGARETACAELASDLRALARTTAAALPGLEQTARALAAAQPGTTAGGGLMKTLARLKSRPRLATGIGVVVMAALLLVIPVPYGRTIGHQVRVTLPPGSTAQVGPLARRIARAVGAERVQLGRAADGSRIITLTSSVRSSREVKRRADAVARTLTGQALSARIEVEPKTERTWGTVYAMALDRLVRVRVETDGKTDEQVADEVRTQLEQAGMVDPQVEFQREGDNSHLSVSADDGEGRALRIVQNRQGGAAGPVELEMGGLDDRREPGMTDAQLKEKIERQLRARGLEPDVTVEGDRIQIRARRHAE
jgi:hypothetical protein